MNTRVHKLRLIGLTSAFAVSIAVGAGYLARQHVRAYQIQAPTLPATVVEVPASAIEEAPDPAVSAPIRFAPLPATATRPVAAGVLPARPMSPPPRPAAAGPTDRSH